MKRLIKFDAWNIEEKAMYYNAQNTYDWQGYREGNGCPATSFGEILEDEEYIVLEYVGLKDKNKKEVRDGDLFYYHGVLRKVEYREDNASWMGIVINGHQGSCNFYLRDIVDNYDGLLNACVIGNIYENPELLEK